MNNVEMWRQLTERHPEMKDPEAVIKLKARGLKALIDQAYQCGTERAMINDKLNYEAFIASFTNTIFGKTKP